MKNFQRVYTKLCEDQKISVKWTGKTAAYVYIIVSSWIIVDVAVGHWHLNDARLVGANGFIW
jgi:hypothetical protein